MPWARSFCPFRAYGANLRKFSIIQKNALKKAKSILCFVDAFASFRAFCCRLFYMQLVTPRVVATAVRMLMITCISVFQVSFFIMIFLSF